jgi:hypothetical protein
MTPVLEGKSIGSDPKTTVLKGVRGLENQESG